MMEVGTLNELREHGKLHWSVDASAWAADPGEVVSALAHAGFQEYKRETARSRRDRTPGGGVWQGLDNRTGAVASAIWVVREDATLIFIDIDGEPVRGDIR
jgi:hypothetical protein